MKKTLGMVAAWTLMGCTDFQQPKDGSRGGGSAQVARADRERAEVIPLDKDCNLPGVKEIEVPIDHEAPEAGSMRYRFQHIEKRASLGTVVHIPGGPGATDIAPLEDLAVFDEMMGDFDRVHIDPRGVGCNYDERVELDGDTISTSQHARDILLVIQSLKLERYIVHGDSYGTVVATHLAALAEKAKAPPSALLLQGIVGGTFEGRRQTFDKSWMAITTNRPEIRALVAAPPAELATSPEEMGRLVATLMTYSPVFALDLFAAAVEWAKINFASEKAKAYLKTYGELKAAFLKSESYKDEASFYIGVACREIFQATDLGSPFIDDKGLLEFRGVGANDYCREARLSLDRAFKPQGHAFSGPVYYVNGSLDPNTPLDWARMHAKRHVSKKKEFIEVAAGGHGPLYAAYELLPCAPQLFRAMLDAESLAVLLDESGHCKRKAAKAGLVESLPALPKAMFSRKPL